MAMIASRNATRDFTPNPLVVPLRVDGKDWNWNRQFGRFGLGGLGGLGLGVMTEAEAIAILGGAQQATATAAQQKEAYETYYGKTGYYSQEVSVQAAAAETSYVSRLPEGPPPPMLYPAMVCGAAEMMSTDCVAYNGAVQRANLALSENARRAWELQVCENNAALTPGTAQDQPCGQYREWLPEPAVPGAVKQQAVCSGGECYTPLVGGGGGVVTPPTPQQQASYIANRANQSVPPPPQPGEIPKDGGAGGGTGDKSGTGDGKIFGMDPVMLAAIAGVGLLLVMRK